MMMMGQDSTMRDIVSVIVSEAVNKGTAINNNSFESKQMAITLT